MYIRVKKSKDSHAFQVVETYRENGKVVQRVVYHIGTLKLAKKFRGQGLNLEPNYEIYDIVSKGQLVGKHFYFSNKVIRMTMIEGESATGVLINEKELDNYVRNIANYYAEEGKLKYFTSLKRRIMLI